MSGNLRTSGVVRSVGLASDAPPHSVCMYVCMYVGMYGHHT